MKQGNNIATCDWSRSGRSQLQSWNRIRLASPGTHEWATFDFGLPSGILPEPA